MGHLWAPLHLAASVECDFQRAPGLVGGWFGALHMALALAADSRADCIRESHLPPVYLSIRRSHLTPGQFWCLQNNSADLPWVLHSVWGAPSLGSWTHHLLTDWPWEKDLVCPCYKMGTIIRTSLLSIVRVSQGMKVPWALAQSAQWGLASTIMY